MNDGGDEEHALPLLTGLSQREEGSSHYPINVFLGYQGVSVITVTHKHTTESHLVFCHRANYKWANHPGQSAHSVGDTHEDTGIARRNVQVVDVET